MMILRAGVSLLSFSSIGSWIAPMNTAIFMRLVHWHRQSKIIPTF